MTRKSLTIAAVLVTALTVLPGAAANAAAPDPIGCDFDGDGYADLAIGSPGSAVSGHADAGRVVVTYGESSFVPKRARTTVLDQNVTGVKSDAFPGEEFGAAVACGDFDGDGKDDLAVGVPGQQAESRNHAGAVHVFAGHRTGVTTQGDFLWTQGVPGVPGVAQRYDRMGTALAVGDFNGDGYDDLAAGAPYDDDPGRNTGAVLVLMGSADGLTPGILLTQANASTPSRPEWGDGYGAALAAGDFNGDGRDDLAVGSPTESVGTLVAAGIVVVTPGTADGLTGAGSVMWHQGLAAIDDEAETFDRFGAALAAGDANGDGRDELAIGVPDENLWAGADAGLVHVLAGSPTGLTTTRLRTWAQQRPALPGTSAPEHRFGDALAFADVTGDGYADLAIGAPGDGSVGPAGSGSVTVLKGSSIGIRARNFSLVQGAMPGGGAAQAGDHFGASIVAADIDGDGIADLAIAAPDEDLALQEDAGDVMVWFGTSGKPLTRKVRRLTQKTLAVPVSGNDGFGSVGARTLASPNLIDTFDSLPAVSYRSSVNTVADLEGFMAQRGFFRDVIDGVYDQRLASAVVSFHKATGRSRIATWSASDWARLDNFIAPIPSRNEPNRIEIDLSQQALYLVEEGEVAAVLSVATGKAETPTPRGDYSIGRHIVGWRTSYLGRLYYPWYFKGGYAIHGSNSVPTQPASHGCVRIEVWESLNIESRLFIGLPVHVHY